MAAKMKAKRCLDVERQGEIYVIHNLLDDKEYAGQTVCGYLIRLKGHIKCMLKGSQRPLYNAMRKCWRKYGDLREFTIECTWAGLESKLNAAEKRTIRQRKTFRDTGWGYNLTTGGDHFKMSKATIRKIRKATKLQWADENVRAVMQQAISVANYCRFEDPIQRQKKAEVTTSLWLDEDYRRNQIRSAESRQKMADFNNKRWADEEYRKAHSTASEEAKKKMSKSQKAVYAANPSRRNVNRTPARREAARLKALAQWAKISVEERSVIARARWTNETYRQNTTLGIQRGHASTAYKAKAAETSRRVQRVKRERMALNVT